jgi:hypothetical protein
LADARLDAIEARANHPTRLVAKADVLALCREVRCLRAQVAGHADRIAAQAELLSRKAER